MEDLELLEINHKNKFYGWANKNGKVLEFETIDEQVENGRRLFTIAAVVDGKTLLKARLLIRKTLTNCRTDGRRNWESVKKRRNRKK